MSLEDKIKAAAAGMGITFEAPDNAAETETAATNETAVDTTTNIDVEPSVEQAAPEEVAAVAETETTSEEVRTAADPAVDALAREYGLSAEDVQGVTDAAQLQTMLDKVLAGVGQRVLQSQAPPAAKAPVEQTNVAPVNATTPQAPAATPTALDTVLAKMAEEGIDESVVAAVRTLAEHNKSLEQKLADDQARRQQEESQRRLSQDENTLLTSLQTLDEKGGLYGTSVTRSEEQVGNLNKVAYATVCLQKAEEQRVGRPVPITPELVKRAHTVAFPPKKPTTTVAQVTPQAKQRMGVGSKANVSPKNYSFQGKSDDTEAIAGVPAIRGVFERARARQRA
jgi:hypothetical protein